MEKDHSSSDVRKAARLAAAIRARALFRTKSFSKVARLLKLADRVEGQGGPDRSREQSDVDSTLRDRP